MSALLEIDCLYCLDGYFTVQLNPDLVDWKLYSKSGDHEQEQLDHNQRLILKYWSFELLKVNQEQKMLNIRQEDGAHQFLLPQSSRIYKSKILTKEKGLFYNFALSATSPHLILEFTNRHGPIFIKQPCSVGYTHFWASRLLKAIKLREANVRRGPKAWLSDALAMAPKDLIDQNLKFSPEVIDGQVTFYLRPPDLLTALWFQFFLSDVDEFMLSQCKICNSYYVQGRGVARADKKFCSSACRQRFYRMNKKL